MRRVWLPLVLAVVVIVLPLALRVTAGAPVQMGVDGAYHVRMAEAWRSGLVMSDPLVAGGRPYLLQPYHILIALSPSILSVVVPAVSALALVWILWCLLGAKGCPMRRRWLVVCLFVLSPVFMLLGASSSPLSLAVLVSIAVVWLAVRGRVWRSGIVGALLPLIDVWSAVVVVLALFALRPRRWGRVALVVGAGALVVAVVQLVLFGVPVFSGLQVYVADTGASSGASVFGVALALIGVVAMWRSAARNVAGWSLPVLVGALFVQSLVPFAVLALSVLGGYGAAWLVEREWSLRVVRQVSLIAVACGVLFSVLSFAVVLAHADPSAGLARGVERASLFLSDVVLTHPSVAALVEGQGRVVVVDALAAPRQASRLADVGRMFGSRSLEETSGLLSKWGVSSILVTDEMRQGLVWQGPEDGLLFVLGNNETFKSVYRGDGVEVWTVLR